MTDDESTDGSQVLETWDSIAAYLWDHHGIGRSTRRVRDFAHRDPPLPVTYPSWASGRVVARSDELDRWAALQHQRAQEHREEQRQRRKALKRAYARMRRSRQKLSANVRPCHSPRSARSRKLDRTSAANEANGEIMLKLRHTGTRREWDAVNQSWVQKNYAGPIMLPDPANPKGASRLVKLGPGDVMEFPSRYLHDVLEQNATTKSWLDDGKLEILEFEDDDEDDGPDATQVASTAIEDAG